MAFSPCFIHVAVVVPADEEQPAVEIPTLSISAAGIKGGSHIKELVEMHKDD